MKILTEKQQLEKLAKEARSSRDYFNNELSSMYEKLRKYEARWFFKNDGDIRVMKYHILHLENALGQLDEYQSYLYELSQKSTN